MNKTAIRILKSLGNADAIKMMESANVDAIKPIIQELKVILTESKLSSEDIDIITNKFQNWLNIYIRAL